MRGICAGLLVSLTAAQLACGEGSGGSSGVSAGGSAGAGGATGSGAAAGSAMIASGGVSPGALPPPIPGEHFDEGCPESEPSEGEPCSDQGLVCAFPTCHGFAQRNFACNDGAWTLHADNSSLCAENEACPGEPPDWGAACDSEVTCVYPVDCCGTPAGAIRAQCVAGSWDFDLLAGDCPACDNFPSDGAACSEELACQDGRPPAVCLDLTCYGGVDYARCTGDVWTVTPGCIK